MNKPSVTPDKTELAELIRKSASRYALLSNDEVNCLAETANAAVRLPAGTLFFAQSPPNPVPIILFSGWACRQSLIAGGRRQIFDFILPGDVVGLTPFPSGAGETAIVALTPVIVARTSAFQRAMNGGAQEFPGFAAAARAMLEQEALRLLNQIARIGKLTAEERVIDLFLELHHRLQDVGLADVRGCSIPITQETLADALGLSLVHVNRTLARLRKAGLLHLRDSLLTLPGTEAAANGFGFPMTSLEAHDFANTNTQTLNTQTLNTQTLPVGGSTTQTIKS